jgi:hypothetical protein
MYSMSCNRKTSRLLFAERATLTPEQVLRVWKAPDSREDCPNSWSIAEISSPTLRRDLLLATRSSSSPADTANEPHTAERETSCNIHRGGQFSVIRRVAYLQIPTTAVCIPKTVNFSFLASLRSLA